MKRIFIDTNVYIDWFNEGAYAQWVSGGGLVRHMSAVVATELAIGATTKRSQREVEKLTATFVKVARLVHPSHEVWAQAGIALRRMKAAGRDIRRSAFVNDVLIALSARDLGATLITRDVEDHAFIAKFVDYTFAPAEG